MGTDAKTKMLWTRISRTNANPIWTKLIKNFSIQLLESYGIDASKCAGGKISEILHMINEKNQFRAV